MPTPFISETIIEQVAENLSNSAANYTAAIQELEIVQPLLLAYLLSENFKLLTEEERSYQLYLSLVIWKSVQQVEPKAADLTEELLDTLEESNWETLNNSTARRFRERLDRFFDNTTQEDLLAFVEDALTDDEEDADNKLITKEGKELVFIGLKTVIDCLCL